MTALILKDSVKDVFDADSPEEYIKTISAQNLYIGIKKIGLNSSGDLISIATPEQLQLLLDFDLWDKDTFNEDNFWDWLAVADQQGDLDILYKVFKSLDLKMVAFIFAKYLDVFQSDEPNDHPPDVEFYTPDKGHTWIKLKVDDPDRHFYLGRFLAIIFDSNPDLFYQILSIPNIATNSILEEESYLDAQRRLNAEGIPDFESSAKVNSVISDEQIKLLLNEDKNVSNDIELPVLDIITWDRKKLHYFEQLAEVNSEYIEQELSFIFNASIIYFNVDLHEYNSVKELASKIRGAINISLDLLVENYNISVIELHKKLGLINIYRYGLTQVLNLKNYIIKKDKKKIEDAIHNPEIFLILSGINERFPVYPMFMDNRVPNQKELEPGFLEFSNRSELDEVTKIIKEYFLA